jgi:hypothetical protein
MNLAPSCTGTSTAAIDQPSRVYYPFGFPVSAITPMSTTSITRVAEYFVMPARRSLGYGEKLVADIPADVFTHMPHPTMNHPAFIIGHLSLYPNRILAMMGLDKLVVPKAGYPELFQAGVACVAQDGRYPGKDELVGYYRERYAAVIDAVSRADDEVFARENPLEGRIKEMFPIVGLAVNFMLNNHHMMHLGQISAWRRAMALPSVM